MWVLLIEVWMRVLRVCKNCALVISVGILQLKREVRSSHCGSVVNEPD